MQHVNLDRPKSVVFYTCLFVPHTYNKNPTQTEAESQYFSSDFIGNEQEEQGRGKGARETNVLRGLALAGATPCYSWAARAQATAASAEISDSAAAV